MLDDATPAAVPRLSGRVSLLQARVLEHCASPTTPAALAGTLREVGLEASVDTTAPGGHALVRIQDDDLALLFDAADGALRIVDVRRPPDAR